MYTIWLCPLALVISHFALVVQSHRICSISKCSKCLDSTLQTAPGIGFHLGLTSGAATISYNDGSFEDIVHIISSPEYVTMMQDLSTHPNHLAPPPMETFWQRMSYVRKQLQRHINRLMGRPGTPYAGILSIMLTVLRSKAESHTSASVTAVTIASANGALTSNDELSDAIRHAGLQSLGDRQSVDKELNCAYGASGLGLCSSYTDVLQCEEEEEAFGDVDTVLHLDYMNKTLSANSARKSKARETYARSEFVDWELGHDLTRGGDRDEYWNAVKLRIEALVTATRWPYTQLLLTGEAANDEKFLEVIKDALGDSKLASWVNTVRLGMDFKYVVARGAAEFQRRRQQGWLDCVQPEYCNEPTFWGKSTARVKEVLAEL